jgi:Zn-finger nucleic acid-binding protein
VSSKAELAKQEGITPLTWVAGPDFMKAGEIPELKEFFDQKLEGPASKYDCPRCHLALRENIYEGSPVHACVHCQGVLLKAEALGRIVVRRFKKFTIEEFQEAKAWYLIQKGNLNDRSPMPAIECPACRRKMFKSIYTESTRVVVDRCTENSCLMIWCDAGELERIQALVEKPAHTL